MVSPRNSIDYARLHPHAKASDFYPNGKLLPEQQINALKQYLGPFKEDARYSKRYLQKLGIPITRGGVIRMYNETTKQYELFAVYKGISLGRGQFGKMKMIQNLDTGEFKALKVLTKPVSKNTQEIIDRKKAEQDFIHEAKGLHLLGKGHKHILTKKVTSNEEDKKKLCIIEDLAPGRELFKILQDGILTVADRFDATMKALLGIKELHDKGMLHRDIKVENLMYDTKTKKLTVIDLGFWIMIDKPLRTGQKFIKKPLNFLEAD